VVAAAVSAAAVLVGVLAPAAHASAPGAGTLAFRSGDGIRVMSVERIDPRDYNVSVLTAALGRPVNIRILIPSVYYSQPSRRYPVLYLYHGTSGEASDWIVKGDAEQITAGLPLIVVMPDAGFDGDGGGWFTNWVDTKTALGPSQWETFHIAELIPWVDSNLRTVSARGGRAVAGLSQGGFGSMTYAARHPDLFVSAASFSGAPDIDYNPAIAAGATVVIEGTAFGLDGVEPQAMFGSRVTDEINWQGHDPTDLLPNLRPVSLWLYTATGLPGPYDPTPANPEAMGIETITHASTVGFYDRAVQLGIPVHYDDYVYGTHSWPYWARDLREYLVPLMRTFTRPPPAPTTISYESVDKSWSQWGWDVSLDRPVDQQWSSLTDANADGFSLAGSGVASVITPALYRPDSLLRVTVSVQGGKASVTDRRAGIDGRLQVTVPLGGDSLLGPVEGAAVMGEPGVPSFAKTATVGVSPARS
jgi:S-formylglutathione hydrolase FrmB